MDKIWYHHGSADSIDLDICYVFKTLPVFSACQQFCCADKAENRNIICISNGEVTDCFKGTTDEVNNSVFATYALHKQKFDLLIDHKVPRDLDLKAVRSVRSILSRFSRSPWRKGIKEALRSSWSFRLCMLEQIASTSDSIFEDLSPELRKRCAFQCGQLLGLLDGEEYYTKGEISRAFPGLRGSVYRERGCAKLLQDHVRELSQHLNQFPHSDREENIVILSNCKPIDLRIERYIDLTKKEQEEIR